MSYLDEELYHVLAYPGGRLIARTRHRYNADRLASNYSISHPDLQVHVRACGGPSCTWCYREGR